MNYIKNNIDYILNNKQDELKDIYNHNNVSHQQKELTAKLFFNSILLKNLNSHLTKNKQLFVFFDDYNSIFDLSLYYLKSKNIIKDYSIIITNFPNNKLNQFGINDNHIKSIQYNIHVFLPKEKILSSNIQTSDYRLVIYSTQFYMRYCHPNKYFLYNFN